MSDQNVNFVSQYNRELAANGEIERFSHMRPGTGKRGRPGVDRINELPAGDVLFVDELTGIAYQGRATLSRAEVIEQAFEGFAKVFVNKISDNLPIIEISEDDLDAIAAVG